MKLVALIIAILFMLTIWKRWAKKKGNSIDSNDNGNGTVSNDNDIIKSDNDTLKDS